MLEIQNVQQHFRSGFWLRPVTILDQVSLAVPRGSITGFLGPNGAGKTSLIQLVTGVRRPKSGSITWNGQSVLKRETRARIGYLPERPYFHDHLTGNELLAYFGGLSGLSTNQIQERRPRLLKRVGLAEAGEKTLRTYSKGMLQRIGIAQALIHEPEFLVLDEPMSGLDPLGRAEMKQIITDLGREGRTVFFSSHIIPDMEAICDRIALIERGKIRKSGPISDLLQDRNQNTEIRFTASQVVDEIFLGSALGADGLYRVTVPSSKVDATLDALRHHQASIIAVSPIHASLEEWFKKP
ncbi:MAG: ABC transporter ATP-binding protein [Bdellovibrionales bacterium]|nr:ABC transporter ATP-binding protein [Bdellovibrionales bacterium]